PELNLSNYDSVDVERLNAWGIETCDAIEALAEQPTPPAASVDVEGLRKLFNRVNRRLEESNMPIGHALARSWESDLHGLLIDSAGGAKGDVTIDLDRVFLDACNDAVRASTWMPAEYMANDWQADVLDLLRNGPGTFTPQPAEGDGAVGEVLD